MIQENIIVSNKNKKDPFTMLKPPVIKTFLEESLYEHMF